MQELGGSTARQISKLADGSIPYHGSHARFINGGWLGGRNLLFSFTWIWIVSSQRFQKCSPFQEFCNIHKIHKFSVPQLLLGGWLQIGHWVVRKIVLYTVWLAYSLLLSLLLSFLVVVSVFPLLSYWTVFQVSPFVHFSSPSRWGVKGTDEWAAA